MKTLALTAITFLLLASGAKAQFLAPLKSYDANESALRFMLDMPGLNLGKPKLSQAEKAAIIKEQREAYKLELLRIQTEAAVRAAELADLQNRRIEQDAFLKGKIIIPR